MSIASIGSSRTASRIAETRPEQRQDGDQAATHLTSVP